MRGFAAGIALFAMLAGCSVPPADQAPNGVYDPQEVSNRQMHAFNRSVDKAFLSPVSDTYDTTVPNGIKIGVRNMGDTVSLPGTVVNQVLQGRLLRAGRNTLRFSVNATLGIVGLFDVASEVGLPEDKSDFGETLNVWGFKEGAYVELPLFGPSTERDAVGTAVDIALDPLGYVLPDGAKRARTGLRVVGVVDDRARLGDLADSVLYDSADSYAQLRLIYLQNRRHELGGGETVDESTYIDPDAIDTEGF